MNRGRVAVALWLLFVAVCIWLIGHARFSADLSVFLPRSPTPEQRLLVEQLRSGVASRVILIGIEGGDTAQRAAASKGVAARLRADPQFLHVANGEAVGLERDRKLLFDYRYVLSPAVTPAHFTVAGLHAAVAQSIDEMLSSAGLFSGTLLTHDPTGEFLRVLDRVRGGNQPRMADGVWVSHDGKRALLLARTRAQGSDTDAQQRALAAIDDAFHAVAAPGLRLVATGPGPFSVQARAIIKHQVARLSGFGMLIIVVLLLAVYRSLPALVIGLLPVLTGALAGIAAVSLGFGTVHGVTLGFGTALIGEAVDYSIYLLTQSEHGRDATGRPEGRWIAAFWPTIRIGVLTSVFGFAPLLLSDFPGLAQLGLYAIAGLITAATVTRFVLPHLLPATLRLRDLAPFGAHLAAGLPRLQRLRRPLFVLVLAACATVVVQRDHVWNRELAALSPVPAAAQALDATMRADLGAPDVRYLVVVTAATQQAALVGSEQVSARLRPLVDAGVIGRFESPSVYLPSVATQQTRLASLPDDATLRRRFLAAAATLPVHADRFAPFFADVTKARSLAPLTPDDIAGTSLSEGVDALLVKSAGRWTALLPLRGPRRRDAVIDATKVRAAVASAALPGVYFLDLKAQSDRLYDGYLHEAILLSLAGLIAIVVLLFAATRSPWRVLRIIAPLAMAVAVVMAGLTLAGKQLTILHLIGMLLIFAVGSNYALFFDRSAQEGKLAPRTLASLLLAATTTVVGFGILAFSSVPVLNAIGATVGPGAILALMFSAILARRA